MPQDIDTTTLVFGTQDKNALSYEIVDCPKRFTCPISLGAEAIVIPVIIEGEKEEPAYDASSLFRTLELENANNRGVIKSPFERTIVNRLLLDVKLLHEREMFFAPHLQKAGEELSAKVVQRKNEINLKYQPTETKEDKEDENPVAKLKKQIDQHENEKKRIEEISNLVAQYEEAISQLKKLVAPVTKEEIKKFAERALALNIILDIKPQENEEKDESNNLHSVCKQAIQEAAQEQHIPAEPHIVNIPAEDADIEDPQINIDSGDAIFFNLATNAATSFLTVAFRDFDKDNEQNGANPLMPLILPFVIGGCTLTFTWAAYRHRPCPLSNTLISLGSYLFTLGTLGVGFATNNSLITGLTAGGVNTAGSILRACQHYGGFFRRNNNPQNYQQLESVAVEPAVAPRVSR